VLLYLLTEKGMEACNLFSITGHTHVELELPPHYFGSGGYSLPIERRIFETV
jgi:hypothetical protein